LQAEFFLAQLNLLRLSPLCFGGLHLRFHGLAFPTSGHGSSLLDYSMAGRRTAFSRLRLCLVQGCGYRAKGQGRISKPATRARVVDPDILGGSYAVFRGTRVSFRNLLSYLKKGQSIDTFLLNFPTVTREQVLAALDYADESVTLRQAF
jgi:uncharacterized protein (DUF433 family)